MNINKNITPFNRWIGRDGYKVEWIVIHYTANTHQPDLARNECAYAASKYIGSSAHFYVDDKSVWQSVALDDTAWHVGDAPSRNGAMNRNSIGIEMCNVYQDGVYSISKKTAARTADLVIFLLQSYPEAKICRHYDVTGKVCPAPWVTNPLPWAEFQQTIEKERPMTPAEKKEFENLKAQVASQSAELAALKSQGKTLATDVKKIDNRTKEKYQTIKECPKWAQPTISKLVAEGDLQGTGEGLALTEDLTRTLVIVDRAGGFDNE